MAVMAEIKGLASLVAKLRAKAARATKDANVSAVVGFTTAYAIYVHEDREAFHPVGQAKFLEQPAREKRPEMGRIVWTAMARGQTLAQSFLLAGLFLQRESQQLVPVDTGNLKGSAFTRLEVGS